MPLALINKQTTFKPVLMLSLCLIVLTMNHFNPGMPFDAFLCLWLSVWFSE